MSGNSSEAANTRFVPTSERSVFIQIILDDSLEGWRHIADGDISDDYDS